MVNVRDMIDLSVENLGYYYRKERDGKGNKKLLICFSGGSRLPGIPWVRAPGMPRTESEPFSLMIFDLFGIKKE